MKISFSPENNPRVIIIQKLYSKFLSTKIIKHDKKLDFYLLVGNAMSALLKNIRMPKVKEQN